MHPVYPHVSVSNFGRVMKRGELVRPYVVNGYQQVIVSRKKRAYVHRLVMEAFEGVSMRLVRRLNGDKKDNRLNNLVWSPTPGKVGEETKKTMRLLLSKGTSLSEISRQTGLSMNHIAYYARRVERLRE